MPIALPRAVAPASRFVPRTLFRSVRTPFIPFTLRAASTMVPKTRPPAKRSRRAPSSPRPTRTRPSPPPPPPSRPSAPRRAASAPSCCAGGTTS
ncbi:hypothetical protein LZ30DRAFT_404891 [Colletotrichum cereale]|nr:hypothetical protein LZ30DRAFT_404891 [Colletotrichum cereale]